jgi:hypothetical protein
MVELIVALVVILALAAGLLQVASLGRAHTEVMVDARREAGLLAMLEVIPLAAPDYIQDWDPGPDGKRLTRDDLPILGDDMAFDDVIVEKAAADDDAWAILSTVSNSIPALRDHLDPVAVFGLVHGEESETVPLLPAVRSLLYQADSIDVRADVWMTRARGIY